MSFKTIGIDGIEAREKPDGLAPPLARQSSIYSLTFDEFHSTIGTGKDFGSMNMEEFLKNIWTAEGIQTVDCAQSGIQRQGSLALPRTLSLKTVDAVWRDFNHENAGGDCGSELQKQTTLGEMTLEEFLVRAGVVREEINQSVSKSGMNSSGNHTSNVFYGEFSREIMGNSVPGYSSGNLAISTGSYVPQLQLGSKASSKGIRGGGIVGIGDPVINNGMIHGVIGFGVGRANAVANQIISDGFAKGNGVSSSVSPVTYSFNGGLRGNKCSGTVEKVVERRQKRMIKNRESAARSRARKQLLVPAQC